ncbi:MAG TPA: hypothetical protein VGR03_12620 [Candidatus Acidoferrum sp.]|nr:hypothetical protein [Candidatus Acidoferrum sp.]
MQKSVEGASAQLHEWNDKDQLLCLMTLVRPRQRAIQVENDDCGEKFARGKLRLMGRIKHISSDELTFETEKGPKSAFVVLHESTFKTFSGKLVVVSRYGDRFVFCPVPKSN